MRARAISGGPTGRLRNLIMTRAPADPLAALRVMLVTDGQGDVARIERIVAASIAGGIRAVQVRERTLTARQLALLGDRLRRLLEPVDGLAIVNDRIDVALAGHFHGVQVGHRSLPAATARVLCAERCLVGSSVHDAESLEDAARARCDWAILAPVWPTSSKPGAPSLGAARAGVLTQGATLPVLWLGGVTPERAPIARREGAHGVAVRSALCDAADPEAVARALG